MVSLAIEMGAPAAGGGGNRSLMQQLTQRKRTENDCGRTETKISCIHRPVRFSGHGGIALLSHFLTHPTHL
jgi:hypothetical protein